MRFRRGREGEKGEKVQRGVGKCMEKTIERKKQVLFSLPREKRDITNLVKASAGKGVVAGHRDRSLCRRESTGVSIRRCRKRVLSERSFGSCRESSVVFFVPPFFTLRSFFLGLSLDSDGVLYTPRVRAAAALLQQRQGRRRGSAIDSDDNDDDARSPKRQKASQCPSSTDSVVGRCRLCCGRRILLLAFLLLPPTRHAGHQA